MTMHKVPISNAPPAGAPAAEPMNWGREFMASVVVFLVALPLCLGVAIASGVPPALGLISGIVGGLVVGVLAGSPFQVSGPAAGLALIVWELVQNFGLAALGVAVVTCGAIQALAGYFKLGRWFRAVSPALIHGLLAGIGVIILVSQFHVMVDVTPTGSGLDHLLAIPNSIARAVSPAEGTNHQLAAAVGVISVLAIVVWNKWRPKALKAIPGPLVAVIAGTGLANFAGMQINYVEVPESLATTFNFPTLETFALLAEPAFISSVVGLALIASAESLLCASAVDRMTPLSQTDHDKELFAQGVGNIVSGVFGALPVTGVIVRSSANVEAGARTRWAAVAHGAWLLLLVALLPAVLTSIPTSCLAAILVYIGYKLAHPKQIVEQWKAGRGEAMVFLVTLVAIVMLGLLAGIICGLVAAMLKLLMTITRIEVDVEEQADKVDVTMHGAATFVRLPTLASALEAIPKGKHVVLHVGGLVYIDHACMDLLRQWEANYEQTGGDTTVAWDDLELRHKADRQQLVLAAAATNFTRAPG